MKKILIIVPYGIEISGLFILANRLRRAASESNCQIDVTVVDRNSQASLNHAIAFSQATLQLQWLEEKGYSYDVWFWFGVYQEPENRHSQVLSSVYFHRRENKRVYFLWERTGYPDVIPEIDLLDALFTHGCDGFFVLNCEQESDLIQHGVLASNIHLISTGIDADFEFTPPRSHHQRQMIRRKLGWSSNCTVALCVSRFTVRKRVAFIANVWEHMALLHSQAQLVFYGSGFGQLDSVEAELYSGCSQCNTISVIPYREDFPRPPLYQAADLFIASGVLEGEPTVLAEAMACKLPVIASRIPGHTRLVRHLDTGLLFTPDNQQELQQALYTLINNPELRQMLGQSGRNLVLKERNIGSLVKKILAVILEESCYRLK